MDGAAARRREDIKHSKYSKEQLPGGYTLHLVPLVFIPLVFIPLVFIPLVFIPLVFEHFGGWGEEALEKTFVSTTSALQCIGVG